MINTIMKTRYISLIILLTGLFCSTANAAETAQELLAGASRAYKSAGGVSAEFILSTGGKKLSGTIKSEGNKFVLKTSGGNAVWYDGSTLYTYNPSEKEVTVESSTAGDVSSINPYGIIVSAPSRFNATLMPSKSGNMYRLKLTPKNSKSGNQTYELYLEKKGLMPVRLVGSSGGKRVGVEVKRYSKGKKYSTGEFSFPKKKYPGVKIVDLR